MHKPRRLLRSHLKELMTRHRPERFQALRDVSFEVNPGESVAIIGRNGAGKSTLLGLVAGLVDPDSGQIIVNGRGAALLQLGSGFHSDLTGIENIHLNASVLGVSRQRTEELMDEIIEFSGIGDFVHEPVRSYSSGMVMRLAFSVAVCVDPDFLIIDEVLAVGDRAFQDKCVERIYKLHQAGKTILCVSHAAATVRELCQRAIWLDEGVLRMDGPIEEVIAAYESGLNLRAVHLNDPAPDPELVAPPVEAGEIEEPAVEEPAVEEPTPVEEPAPEPPPVADPEPAPPPIQEPEPPPAPIEEPEPEPILEAALPSEEPAPEGEASVGESGELAEIGEPPAEEIAPYVPPGPPCEEELAYIKALVLEHYCFVDYQNRTLMPQTNVPALIVPIDYEEVVPREKGRDPYAAITSLLETRIWAYEELHTRLEPFLELPDVADELADPTDEVSPFWKNIFFTGMDARAAYALIRAYVPGRIVEIGSGNSTRFLRKAIRDGKLKTQITCIDPSPRLSIKAVADEVREESLIATPLEYFASLQPGDFVFFDGSHICFHDSDVTHFFLRVMPMLPKGVLVHVHDIYLPEEYPEHFDIRYYNEQYMLAAFLLWNSSWKPFLPVHFLHGRGILNADGCSFWLMNGHLTEPEPVRRRSRVR
ncbi:ATP-binding cassette domain-containing protein [Paludibaculum fermentans]|uniref:ATP-binding cassette domain-containing protein n=1 Tax=Paludibaculum fermentans TaxID=1473598 RepID=A0A7S7NKT6_PALFE|nr:ATP-binding cassette domain-containing protein [Paludibaculum fermentans]QOY85408.1 ATP-binding cassette domain-containing protein [Paludibaculum fermentans]